MKLTLTVEAVGIGVHVGTVAAFAESSEKRVDCSTLDVAAISTIEEHGRAAGIPSQRLYGLALVLQQARKACRDALLHEAQALYDVVLSVDPVVGEGLRRLMTFRSNTRKPTLTAFSYLKIGGGGSLTSCNRLFDCR